MEQNPENLFELQIDPVANGYLTETAKWAKFLSIIGFIVCGFIVLGGIGFASMLGGLMQNTNGMGGAGFGLVSIIYIAFAALYFFPCLYLYRFSVAMQAALAVSDNRKLQESFMNLKSTFKFMGILTIIILAFYALAIVFGGLAAMFGR
ncbi:MAG: DUF5362 family protein [Flavihumibacter sp.]